MKTRRNVVAILIVSLVLFVVGTFIHPTTNSLALGKVQYKVVPVKGSTQSLQQELDKWSNDGWELVAVEASIGHLIFKK